MPRTDEHINEVFDEKDSGKHDYDKSHHEKIVFIPAWCEKEDRQNNTDCYDIEQDIDEIFSEGCHIGLIFKFGSRNKRAKASLPNWKQRSYKGILQPSGKTRPL